MSKGNDKENTMTNDMGYAVMGPGTYDVKDQLRRLGGKWNPTFKAWAMPNEEAFYEGEELRRAAAAKKPTKKSRRVYDPYGMSQDEADYEDFGPNDNRYRGL